MGMDARAREQTKVRTGRERNTVGWGMERTGVAGVWRGT